MDLFDPGGELGTGDYIGVCAGIALLIFLALYSAGVLY
jgi:hypothetical protein